MSRATTVVANAWFSRNGLKLMSNYLGMLARMAGIVSFALMLSLHSYGRRPVANSRNVSPLRQNAIIVLDSTIDEVNAVEDVEARVIFAVDILGLFGDLKHERCRQMLDIIFDDLMKFAISASFMKCSTTA